MTIAAIVLAAGQSSRMGGVDKLVCDVGGEPIIRRVVEAALEARLSPVIVVTGPNQVALRSALAELDVAFVANPDAASGLSTSLKMGVGALRQGLDGAMILLGDMPLVTGSLLRRLVAAFEAVPGGIAAVPLHEGEWGNPVILAPVLFPEIGTLQGDAGARRLLEDCRDSVIEVAISDDAVTFDVDTPAQLEKARAKAAERI